MFIFLTLAVASAQAATSLKPRAVDVRNHRYRRIGHHHDVPIYRTRSTDSTSLDRAELPFPAILMTRTSKDPNSADGQWPAPRGNLYFSTVVPMSSEEAKDLLNESLTPLLQEWLSEKNVSIVWDGAYGAHRAPDGRFVSGMVVQSTPEGTEIGIDVHLRASARAYRRLDAEADHASIRTLTGQAPSPARALQATLDLILTGRSMNAL